VDGVDLSELSTRDPDHRVGLGGGLHANLVDMASAALRQGDHEHETCERLLSSFAKAEEDGSAASET